LIWETPKENQARKVEAGTHGRGEMNAMAKLEDCEAALIRSERARGVPVAALAIEFMVSERTIYDIASRRRRGKS
jgi:hypothetical protein